MRILHTAQLLHLADKRTSRYLLFLLLLLAADLHTSEMSRHVRRCGAQPPVPAGAGPGCSLPSVHVGTWVHGPEVQRLHLPAEPHAAVACPNGVDLPCLVSKGTL